MPSWITAKLIGYGLAGLALLWAAIIVLGWRHDSQALPQIEAARVQAVKDRDQARDQTHQLETRFAGQLDHISDAVLALQQRYAAAETQAIADRGSINDAIDTFKKATAHVQGTPLPGSADDVLVRARLLDLLRNPDTGQLGRGDGGGQGGAGAAMPAGAGEPHDVPGRRPAAADQPRAVVPGAKQGGRSGAKRSAEGRRRRSDWLGTAGAKGPAAAERLGQAVPGVRIFVTGSRRCGKNAARELAERCLASAGIRVIHG